jgi:hypothetical protein
VCRASSFVLGTQCFDIRSKEFQVDYKNNITCSNRATTGSLRLALPRVQGLSRQQLFLPEQDIFFCKRQHCKVMKYTCNMFDLTAQGNRNCDTHIGGNLVGAREEDERLRVPLTGLRRSNNLCTLSSELVKDFRGAATEVGLNNGHGIKDKLGEGQIYDQKGARVFTSIGMKAQNMTSKLAG